MECLQCEREKIAKRLPCDSDDYNQKMGRKAWIWVWICPVCSTHA